MPLYTYKCKACNKVKEVFHSISEIDDPSNETLEKISCPYDRDCASDWFKVLGMELPEFQDLKFQRVIHAPHLKGMYNATSLSGKEKREAIKSERSLRGSKHFKKTIYPNIPKSEKKIFDKKWKNEGKDL